MPGDAFEPFHLRDFTDLSAEAEAPAADASEEGHAESFEPLDLSSREIDTTSFELQEQQLTDDQKVSLSTHFSNESFTREDSLLTNAESYAATVREGAELYRQQLVAQVEAENQKARKLRQETEQIRAQADEERVRMIREAEAEVQAIKDQAYGEGFEQGRLEGLEQRYQEAAPLVEQSEQVLEQLRGLRHLVRFQAEQELVQLSVVIAKKVVIEELQVNPEVIIGITQAALKELHSKGKIIAYLHPDCYDFLKNSGANLEQFLDEEQSLTLKPSADVQPGAVSIESDEEVVNHSFQNQFEELENLLSQKLLERYARMNDVDMDAYDFGGGTATSGEPPALAEDPAGEPA